jgi:hypothetical protein
MRKVVPLPVRLGPSRLGDLTAVASRTLREFISLVEQLTEMHTKRGRRRGVDVEHTADTTSG